MVLGRPHRLSDELYAVIVSQLSQPYVPSCVMIAFFHELTPKSWVHVFLPNRWVGMQVGGESELGESDSLFLAMRLDPSTAVCICIRSS